MNTDSHLNALPWRIVSATATIFAQQLASATFTRISRVFIINIEKLSVSQTVRHCMLAWWKEWYYDRDQFQTTPSKRPLTEASQKYRRLILLEKRLTTYRNSLVPSEVVELDSGNSTVDDDYLPSINEEQ